ncbi:hypothetical protein C8A00DRAFT_45267 [Chaetomidium leptoderma]|uniref:Transcription factor domain-containing protein n=1 Tax=Chaetomidium leptoderma TaxID=669021 RepID=A0AAN6ZUN0_9PEZI|nr:hypothetical protein C8A00DRAFT_45267 [Chaetomidium leptoderma]
MVETFLEEPSRDADAPNTELQPDSNIETNLTENIHSSDEPFLSWGVSETYSDIFPDLSPFDLSRVSHPIPNPEEDIDPALAHILTSLEHLHNTLITTAEPSYSGTTFNPTLAKQIFVPSHRKAFLPTYFRHTHKHLPLVHHPTFNVTTSSPALVLVLFLCGALYAPPRDAVLAIPAAFFPIAEEFVFRRVEVLLELHHHQQQQQGGDDDDDVVDGAGGGWVEEEREMYETLQAAVLVRGAQFMMNTSNNPAVRSRAWMVRRPVLVEVVRKLGLACARHTNTVGRRPDWGRFVRDEIRIRIAAWVLLDDWQQAGVFHLPVLMTTDEMTGELPCLQELWEANDATEFEAVVTANGQRLAASWSGVGGFSLGGITMLDLHLLISSIYVIIGTARHHSLLQTCIPALQRATARWEELGVVRHCGEFCWLANTLLKHSLAGKDKTTTYFQRRGHETPKELHGLLRELREGQ